MSAEKKPNREKTPHPDTREAKHKGRNDNEGKEKSKEKGKARKVNYVVKDLPIY